LRNIIRCGFDIDGTITNMNLLITEISSKLLGIELDPSDTEYYFLRYNYGGIPLSIEKAIIEEALSVKSSEKLQPIEGAIEVLKEWSEFTKEPIIMITAREDDNALLPFINNYLKDQFPFKIYYGFRQKGALCKELNITHFIDDFIFNLIDIANSGIIPLIFDQPYNRKINRRMSRLAQRIYSWKHFKSIYLLPKISEYN